MSKSTQHFQEIIEMYLNNLAAQNELFEEKYKNESKSIEKCVDYIIDQVSKTGKNGFADAEIFGIAVHYYEEDTIEETTTKHNVRIVTNQHDDSPNAPIKQTTQSNCNNTSKQPNKATKQPKIDHQQPSLF